MSRIITAAAMLGLLLPGVAPAQYPTDMSFCFGTGLERCMDVGGSTVVSVDCQPPKVWESFYGRVAWYPLRYVGPITIEVEALRFPKTWFPVYIEYIPLKNRPPDVGFCDGPGSVIMTVWGGTGCDPRESSGPISLPLEVGDLYFIRAHWFDTSSTYHAVLIRCIQLTAQAQPARTELEPMHWGLVKRLYR